MTNPFDGIDDAKPSLGGNYVIPGEFLFKVDALKMVKRQQGGSSCFVAELMTIESDQEACPVGSSRSWVADFKHQPSLGNVRGFLGELASGNDFVAFKDDSGCVSLATADDAEAIDVTPENYVALRGFDDISTAVASAAVADDQPFKDAMIRCSAFTIKTKGKGQDFTKCKWASPVAEVSA